MILNVFPVTRGVCSFVYHFQINYNGLYHYTALMCTHQSYNYKLCRKGLLERGLSVGKMFDDFNNLENNFLKKKPISKEHRRIIIGIEQLQDRISEQRIATNKERIRTLDKSIMNLKSLVGLKMNESSYEKWLKQINESSMKFRTLFSNENNRLFDHLYVMKQNMRIP